MSRSVAQLAGACIAVQMFATAVGQTPPSPSTPAQVFESLDKNSDGKVTLAEASSNDELFVAFKSLDKDKNGELSKEEFAAYQPKKGVS